MTAKKAQGAAIAGFIILMLLIILGYLFFLPFSEKCKIIPDLSECSNLPSSEGSVSNVQNAALSLISEKPGLIVPKEDSAEYDLGTVNLFNKVETDIPIKISVDPFVEKSWFSEKVIEQQFSIPG